MLCLAVIVGRLLAVRLAERDGMDRELMGRCCAWTLAGALVGARLLYVVTNPGQFQRFGDAFRFWEGGMVAYGGFLGGFLGSLIFCRVHDVRALAWADAAVPSVCVGIAITRIGCLLAGCDFGLPWDGPWAVRFPVGSPAFQQQAALGLLPFGATESLPVHPTQVYETLAGLALFGVVTAVRRRRELEGHAFAAFALGYAALRYAIEVVRADAHRGSIGPLSTSQVVAVVTFLAALVLLRALRSERRVAAALAPQTGGSSIA
jgi:phosphatidylglycerol:prolipoprotein diacylglycerol transferase